MRTLAAGWVLALVVGMVAPAAAEPVPRLVVREAVFDFGAVERGARVDHTFTVSNGGDATLRLDNVKSSCGCTVAVMSDRDVPPGGQGRITVSLDTAGMAGRKTKTVTVYTNDPDAPATGLSLTGDVLADLVLTPSPLYLGRVRHGERARREVTVTPGRPGATYAVTAVEHGGGVVKAHLETRADVPGQRLVVELDPDIPVGHVSEQLTLRTTSPHDPVMILPVFGSVEGDVAVLPPQVTFGITDAGAAPERDVVIRSRGARPLAVTAVRVHPKQVGWQLREVHPGTEYRLTLRLEKGVASGKIEGAVEILTDDPEEDRIVVPVYAVVRGAAGARDGRRRRH